MQLTGGGAGHRTSRRPSRSVSGRGGMGAATTRRSGPPWVCGSAGHLDRPACRCGPLLTRWWPGLRRERIGGIAMYSGLNASMSAVLATETLTTSSDIRPRSAHGFRRLCRPDRPDWTRSATPSCEEASTIAALQSTSPRPARPAPLGATAASPARVQSVKRRCAVERVMPNSPGARRSTLVSYYLGADSDQTIADKSNAMRLSAIASTVSFLSWRSRCSSTASSSRAFVR